MSQPGTAVRRSRNTLRNDAGHLPPRVLSRSPGLVNLLAALLSVALLATPRTALAARYTLIGWNNLGMHCMDGDYSVLSLLPPYNTIHAQLVSPTGALIDDPSAAGITVTYRAVADPSGVLTLPQVKVFRYGSLLDLQRHDVTGVTPGTPVPHAGIALSRHPARGVVQMGITWPGAGAARAALYDVSGRQVRLLWSGVAKTAAQSLSLDTGTLPPGLFLIGAEAGGRRVSRRMVVLR